jgi:hypothetical protein
MNQQYELFLSAQKYIEELELPFTYKCFAIS